VRAVVVGGELCRQAVPGVGKARTDRHQDARGARAAAKAERGEGGHADDSQRQREARPGGVVDIPIRRREREQRHTQRDGGDTGDLGDVDLLGQSPDGEGEQEDEARPEQRLHDRERRPRQRERLQRPARETEPGSRQPARPADEPAQQREAERMIGGRRLRLPGLEHDAGRIERRGRERDGDSASESRHG